MTEEYYVLEGGEKLGPFTERELLDRPLEPADKVLLTLETEWKAAHSLSQFTGYFKSEGIFFPTKENTRSYRLRLPAFLIDMIMVLFGTSQLISIFLGRYMQPFEAAVSVETIGNQAKMKEIYDHYYPQMLVTVLMLIFVMFIYHSLCEISRMRGSVGKYIFGLAVVDELGYILTLRQAVGRNLGKLTYELPFLLINIPALLILLSIPFTPMHQAIHDRFSGCYIVSKKK